MLYALRVYGYGGTITGVHVSVFVPCCVHVCVTVFISKNYFSTGYKLQGDLCVYVCVGKGLILQVQMCDGDV